MAGLIITKEQLNEWVGVTARTLRTALARGKQQKDWFDAYSDQELTLLGLSAQDITALRAAVEQLNTLAELFAGNTRLMTQKDFRVELRKVWGLGETNTGTL